VCIYIYIYIYRENVLNYYIEQNFKKSNFPCPGHEDVTERKGVPPLILNLRQWMEDSDQFHATDVLTPGKKPCRHWRLDGVQNVSGRFEGGGGRELIYEYARKIQNQILT
jgi:hypothetical protein